MRRLLPPSISFPQLATSAATLVLAAFVVHAQKITTFDPPNSTETVAVAINLKGQIAGTFIDRSTPPFISPQRGFLRERDGTFTAFEPEVSRNGATFGSATWVTDLNLEGEIVGFSADPGAITTSGFLRRKNGTIVTFKGGPSGPSMASRAASTVDPTAAAGPTAIPCDRDELCIDGAGAFAINARDEITGVTGNLFYDGFLRYADGTTIDFNPPAGAMISPQAINQFGQITGFYGGFIPNHGFLRQPNGKFVEFDPPNSTDTRPQAINLFSQIAGYFTDTKHGIHGFVRQPNGKIAIFDPPGSIATEPLSINLHGEITGAYLTADQKSHGFLRSANGEIETFDVQGAGSLGTVPKEINDLGEIVGYYEDGNSVVHGFVRSPRR